MAKSTKRGKGKKEDPDFVKEITSRTEPLEYGIDVPLDDSLDNIMEDWSPVWSDEYAGGGFVEGDGCEWEDVRVVEFEVEIDRWTMESLIADTNAILSRMFKDVRDDMNSRPCVKPCEPEDITWEKISSGAYYQRRPRMRPYPEGERPHDWRLYDHYWHLVFTITYKYTKKCSR